MFKSRPLIFYIKFFFSVNFLSRPSAKTKTKTNHKTRTSSKTTSVKSAALPSVVAVPNRTKRDAGTIGIPEKFITASSKVMSPQKSAVALAANTSNHTTSTKKKSKKTKTKSKQTGSSSTKKSPKARGTLYGLSTLKRQGMVRVNAMADHTTVKSNFVLGPLMLKVEKPYGRGANRSLKSATATTTEMLGRINLRIVNGAATLHSIKVQQPKQVCA